MDRVADRLSIAPLPAPSAVIELLKPITWFPPMWAFGCGIVSSDQPVADHVGAIALGILLAGPLVCGTSQVVNDWFDRHVDAINEPNRPIPSGRVSGRWGLYIAIACTLLSLLVASALGPWVFGAAVVGLVLAWAYSAPPTRLKRNGWYGNTAVAACYEGLPWITGAALMLPGASPDWRILVIAVLYSAGAHGIMVLNDFKSMRGDQQVGLASLPVQLGAAGAARLACVVMASAQAIVIVLLFAWSVPLHAAGVTLLLIAQLALMARFLKDPEARAIWYSGFGVTLYVLGMLISAFALAEAT